jgi:hypothetical protein
MGTSHEQWAEKIVEAYGAETTPPITPQLKDELRRHLAKELTKAVPLQVPSSDWGSRINPILDEWEKQTGIVGPRLTTIDETAGTVRMIARSQAAHPLRPFGGQ